MISNLGSENYEDYDEYDEGSDVDTVDTEEEKNAQKDAQIAEWKKQSNQLRPNGAHVYILTLEEIGHDHEPWFKTIGIFDSKAAAVAKSASVNTVWGTFDEAMKDTFSNEDEFDNKDNRMNPPDNGVLIQVGGEDYGMGDYSRLVIKKHSILSLVEPNQKHTHKRTSRVDGRSKQASRIQKKRKKANCEEIIELSSDE